MYVDYLLEHDARAADGDETVAGDEAAGGRGGTGDGA